MPENENRIGRRDLLKGIAGVPVLGALAYAWHRKRKFDKYLKQSIREEISLDATLPA